jgi:hypothetical protein
MGLYRTWCDSKDVRESENIALSKRRESKKGRNKKYKKTNNDGLLRNQKYV